METRNIVISIVASAVLSAAGTAAIISRTADETVAGQPHSEAIEQRLQSLEKQLAQQRENNQDLRQKIDRISGRQPGKIALADSLTLGQVEQEFITNGVALTDETSMGELKQSMQQKRAEAMAQYRARFQPQYKLDQLRNVGLSDEQANRVLRTESEFMLEQLQAQYDARRKAIEEGDPNSPWNRHDNNGLREKLGDELYESYLEANNRPTSIGVGSVMENSPGANAGLQAGDVIVSYDNKRVFDTTDLNRLTAQGRRGESTLLEIERNGNPVQLTIPRGPIGVTSDGTGFRRSRE